MRILRELATSPSTPPDPRTGAACRDVVAPPLRILHGRRPHRRAPSRCQLPPRTTSVDPRRDLRRDRRSIAREVELSGRAGAYWFVRRRRRGWVHQMRPRPARVGPAMAVDAWTRGRSRPSGRSVAAATTLIASRQQGPEDAAQQVLAGPRRDHPSGRPDRSSTTVHEPGHRLALAVPGRSSAAARAARSAASRCGSARGPDGRSRGAAGPGHRLSPPAVVVGCGGAALVASRLLGRA